MKTGILPSIITSPLPSDDITLPSPSDKEQDSEIEEVQRLLDQYENLTSDEVINAKEFILIDDDDNYGEGEIITDEEIVNMLKSNEMDLEEEELILEPKIPTSEALESLDKVLSFINNPPYYFTIAIKDRILLENLKKQMIPYNNNSKIQSGLKNRLGI